MKTALSVLLLAGTLPVPAFAQSGVQTQATISLYEQPGGLVLGADRPVYTNYFNSLRTRFVAVPVTLEYPAAVGAHVHQEVRLVPQAARCPIPG